MPAITVAITTHNLEKYIRSCFEELQAQSFQDFEILVYDDCSTDRTGEMLTRLQAGLGDKLHVILGQIPQKLPSKSRNALMDSGQIHGKYVVLLVLGLTLFCCLCAYFAGVPVLGFVYGKDLSGLVWHLTFIVFGGGIFAACQLFYYIFVIMRRQRVVFRIYAVAAVVSLGLAFAMASAFGIMGAVLAFSVSHALILAVYILLLAHILPEKQHGL